MVREVRLEEMAELAKHVYEKVPLEDCWTIAGEGPIGSRWVDVNKGDDANPEYRSRLVGKEIRPTKEKTSSRQPHY